MMENNNKTGENFSFVYVNVDDKNSILSLSSFYESTYVTSFTDKNERESLDNILDYLIKKKDGWYEKNNYHVILVQKNNEIVGGLICDYFSGSNCGAIEFIVVDTDCQFKGIGTALYEQAIERLQKDAKSAGNVSMDYIFCEIEKVADYTDIKGMNYLWFWDKKGYKKLRLDYIQPSLDSNKDGVFSLDLVATKINSAIAVDMYMVINKLKAFLYDYAKYAMRIEDPMKDAHIIRMVNNLDSFVFPTIGFDTIMPKMLGGMV